MSEFRRSTYDAARNLETHAAQLVEAVEYGHTKMALYKVADLQQSLVNAATELVEDGIHDGLSQAEIARCMNVPASTLRGAKQEFSRSAS